MGNKFDLQSFWFVSTAALATNTTNIGSQVADGKTRFLTHIRIERTQFFEQPSAITEVEVFLATQTTGSSFISSLANVKAVAQLDLGMPPASDGTTLQAIIRDSAEMKGTVEQPLLTISGGSTLVLGMGSAAVSVFAQYYDE